MNERYEGTDRTTQLRKAYARASRRGGRRDLWAAGLVAVGLLCLMLVPALAETQHTYRLQGANIATEFVVQPYWLASGSLDGHHFRFESGLIGFTDGQGVPGTGYCIDARTHRQHAASYTDGANLDAAGINNSRQILWLLRNAYPKGPALLGDDPRGLARSSSAVQAAIWYFSDGFQLDPAGAPYVDAAYRGSYDRLIAEANAAPAPAHGHMTLTGPSGIVSINSLPADHGVDVTANVILDDGSTVADGTEVSLSSDDGNLSLPGQAGVPHPASSPLLLRTVAGHVTAHLVVAAAATKHVTISATAELPTAPGKVLNPNAASQRLVETSWGKETASAQVGLDFTAHAVPTITKSVRDMSTTKGVALADTQNPAILAKTGDHLRYQIACGNSGLVPYSGTVVDELAAPKNLNMTLLQNVHGFVVGADGKEVAAPASASTLRWPVSVAPGTGCTVGFEADIPKALSAPTTSFVNCAYVLAPGAHPGSASSNCVTVVVQTQADVLALKLVDNGKSGSTAPGSIVTYTIQVTNTGNRNLAGVAVADNLGRGSLTQLSDVAVKDGTFDPATRGVSWTIAELPAGASATVSFTARVPGGKEIACGQSVVFENVAEVSQPGLVGGLAVHPTDTATLKVSGVDCIPPAVTKVPPITGGVEAAQLPFTGVGHELRSTIPLGLGLLLVGAGLLMASRRPEDG